MSWIFNDDNTYRIRITQYNSSYVLSRYGVNGFTSNFDGIFDNFINFTDTISSLKLFPFIIPTISETNQPYLVTSKGVARDDSSNPIPCYRIDGSKCYMNLGQLYINPKFGNFADYKGYTQIKCYLPFLGFVDLDVNDVMDKWVQFRLKVDYFTGKGLHIIGVSENASQSGSFPLENSDSNMRILSTYECDLGIDIPLGTSNISDIKRNLILGSIKTAASLYSSIGALSLPSAKTTTTTTKSRYNKKGEQIGKTTINTEKTYDKPYNKHSIISDTVESSVDILNRNYAGSHTDRVNDSGLMWSASNNVKVIIYRPVFEDINKKEYGNLIGFPYGKISPLSMASGYTEITSIHFEGEDFKNATTEELSLLEEVVGNGVIFRDRTETEVTLTIEDYNNYYPKYEITTPQIYTFDTLAEFNDRITVDGICVYFDGYQLFRNKNFTQIVSKNEFAYGTVYYRSTEPSFYSISGVWIAKGDLQSNIDTAQDVNYTSNNRNFYRMLMTDNDNTLIYQGESGAYIAANGLGSTTWSNENYKTVDFGETPQDVSGDFYLFMVTNFVKQ